MVVSVPFEAPTIALEAQPTAGCGALHYNKKYLLTKPRQLAAAVRLEFRVQY